MAAAKRVIPSRRGAPVVVPHAATEHARGLCPRRCRPARRRRLWPHAGTPGPASGAYDHERHVPQPALWRHGRAGPENHRRVHLQAPQEARRGFRREELYRDRLGSGVRAPRAGSAEARGIKLPPATPELRTSRAGLRAYGQLYRAVIAPLLVAISQNPSRSEMASTRPIPGTTSPAETSITPDGPSKTATPSTTSLTNQCSTFLGSFGAAFGALFAFATVTVG